MTRNYVPLSRVGRPCRSRRRAAALLSALAAGGSCGLAEVARAATWNGGNGNWNSANWTGGVPNFAAATALIDGGKAAASTVTLDISPSISSLTLDSGDTLSIGDSRTLTLSGGATVNGTVAIVSQGISSGMVFNGGAQTLGGSGQVTFGGPAFTFANGVGGTGPLTIGPALTIRTDTQSGNLAADTLTNQGMILAQTTSRSISIGGARLVNQGTIRCTFGLLSIGATSWTNTGSIQVASGGLVLLGGTVTTAGLNVAGMSKTGGSFNITGTVDNTGAVLPLSATSTGSFSLQNGTIRGGTVTTAGGSQLFVSDSAAGTLDSVNLQALMRVNNGARLNVLNGLQIGVGFDVTLASTGSESALVFDSAQTLSGEGQVRFEGSTSAVNVIKGTGALTIGPNISVLPGSFSAGGTINVATLINQGSIFGENAESTVTISSPTFVSNGTLRAEFNGTMIITAGVTGTGAASVGPSGTIRATFLRQGSLSLEGTAGDPTTFGRVTINTKATGGQTSTLKSLTIQLDAANKPLGVLDLADTALVIDYTGGSPMAVVRAALVSGYANGLWTGPGITSSVAAANTSRALGYAEASEVLGAAGGTFQTQPADGTSVLVRFTLAGDANLDGAVDFNDLVKLAQNYNTTVSATGESWWFRGDFTFDGIVDFNDLVKLAQNYNTALPASAIPGASVGFANDLAAAFESVPEPGCAVTALAACGLAGGRSRRRVARVGT